MTEAEEIKKAIEWMYEYLQLPNEEQFKAEEEYFKATSGYPTPLFKTEN